jgi:hypothetical protein
MRIPLRLALSALALLVPARLAGQEQPFSATHLSTRIPRAELDAITTRGRELAAYDAAAWHGTDALMALHPAEGSFQRYVARRTADGRWEVLFGIPSAAGDTFAITYRAVQGVPGDTVFKAKAERSADTEWAPRANRALQLGIDSFGRVNRPYNAAVLPVEGSSDWWVYLYPAATVMNVWPLGADLRYRVSADGRRVLETRRMHNGVIEYDSRRGTPAAGMHTAVLADRPEDSDVFLVLQRRPSLPEYIVSETFYFRIDTDGHITAYDREAEKP